MSVNYSPVVLSFLAPAAQCNQRCPACVIDLADEPVTEFVLTPANYADLVERFVHAGVPIRSVSFQGYEVTLPRSWPYLQSTFRVAQALALPRDFITNGMLLSRRCADIRELDPHRITVSLDGADPRTNDPLRGLRGAFEATLGSLRKFLSELPEFSSRLAVASTLYPGRNFRSLETMPTLLRSLGVTRWSVGWELIPQGGLLAPSLEYKTLREELIVLRQRAEQADLDFHASDDLGLFRGPDRSRVAARSPTGRTRLLRFDPLGHVRTGEELDRPWGESTKRRWEPSDANGSAFRELLALVAAPEE